MDRTLQGTQSRELERVVVVVVVVKSRAIQDMWSMDRTQGVESWNEQFPP